MSRLVFNEARHTYSLDGVWVPGVTGIIRNATSGLGLLKWSATSAAEWCATHVDELASLGEVGWIAHAVGEANRRRDEAGRQGKQVHSLAQRMIYGEPVEPTDPATGEPYLDDVWRMGEQVARFLDAWDVTPDEAIVEAPIFHDELGYAGTLDLCGILRGGERWLIDYKTSPSGVWPDNALQLTAYARARYIVVGGRDMLMPPINRCAVLWVRPDHWELTPVKSDERVWATFQHMIPVSAFARARREEIVGAPLPEPESEVA